GGNRHMADTALVTLVLQEPFVQHVQLGDPPGYRHAAQPEQADDQAKTPGIEAAIGLEREFLHGRTRTTSFGSGTRMPNSRVAMASTRLWAVQVLCSRTNRPHSAWAFSRWVISVASSLSSWRLQWAL